MTAIIKTTKSLCLFLQMISLWWTVVTGFTVMRPLTTASTTTATLLYYRRIVFPFRRYSLMVLQATKKKRRHRIKPSVTNSTGDKMNGNETSPISSGGANTISDANDLPDFDLDLTHESDATVELHAAPIHSQSKAPINPEEMSPSMMVDVSFTKGKLRSLDELLMDRSLESKFKFDEPEDLNIPDFIQFIKESSLTTVSSTSGNIGDVANNSNNVGDLGKKKKRQAKRVSNAIRRKEEEEKDITNIWAIVSLFTNDDGKIRAVKVLEYGAWLGIILLVGWELYINSPFFDRAAPLAPFVYELFF